MFKKIREKWKASPHDISKNNSYKTNEKGIKLDKLELSDYLYPNLFLIKDKMAKSKKQSDDHRLSWQLEAREAYDLVAGHQLAYQDIKKERPNVVFNRIAPVIDAVVGTEMAKITDICFKKRLLGGYRVVLRDENDTLDIPNEDAGAGAGAANSSDESVAAVSAAIASKDDQSAILNDLAKAMRDDNDALSEEMEAFTDMLTCGMGWLWMEKNGMHAPSSALSMHRVNPFNMYWDPEAKRPQLSDARWIMHQEEIGFDKYADLIPYFVKKREKSLFLDKITAYPWVKAGDHPSDIERKTQEAKQADQLSLGDREGGGFTDNPDMHPLMGGRQTIRVTHYEFKQSMCRDDFLWLLLARGDQKEATKQASFIDKDAMVDAIIRVCMVDDIVVSVDLAPHPFAYSFLAMTGKKDMSHKSFYGIVRHMKDPQLWANRWLAQMLYIINSNTKGGLMAEVGAFANSGEMERYWADPASVTLLNEGALEKIQFKPKAEFPNAVDHLLQFAIHSIRDVTGVNPEMLGNANRNQSGYLEHERKQAANTLLALYFRSMRQCRLQQGLVMMYHFGGGCDAHFPS